MTDYQHDIEKYLRGELTPAERHALEKKALSDPFLADALEGAEQLDATSFAGDVDELKKKFAERKEKSFWQWPMRIAAGVAILIASSYIVWMAFDSQPETKQLALEQKQTAPVQPSVADSSITEELASQPAESSTAGPEKETEPRSTDQSKTDTKPIQPLIVETRPETAVAAAEEAGESTPVTKPKTDEDVVHAMDTEEAVVLKDKSEEVQRAKKLSLARDDQKKEAAVPSARSQETRGATLTSQRIIRGRVTSAEDGSALPGVNVVIKGSTTGTVTDVTGNYQIEVSNFNPVLVYSFIGLESTEVTPGDRTEVDVAMSLDVTQLSEVVVAGYGYNSGTPAPPTVDLAHPTTGYRMFKQYLQQNIKYPEQARINKTEGKVTVEFTVEANGTLTNFRIIRGIGSGCDDELIRLIKEGPAWIPTKKDGMPIQDKARVRLKFELPE